VCACSPGAHARRCKASHRVAKTLAGRRSSAVICRRRTTGRSAALSRRAPGGSLARRSRQQDLEVLRARVDVLRDDVHAGIQKLGDRAPLLGQVALQARRVFCDDHGELFTARRPEQALVPGSFGSAPANGRVREALHDREAVALGQAAQPAVGY
jgi:hypothetical protein